MDIVVDSFTAADGVAAQNVLETARDIAGVSSLRSIQVVQSYSDSPLLQAADLMAWTYNRALTNFRFKKVDQPYREVFGRLMQHGKTLAGRYLRDLEARPPSTTTEVVCIAYALARNAIRADHPQFVDDVFVSIKEFHRRALATLVSNSPGVSVLTEEGHRRAAAFAASKMTGPRSETAAE